MRVLIADDHLIVRDALDLVISGLEADTVVLQAGSFTEAVEIASQDSEFDLAVLDLRMPGMEGSKSITEFRAQFPAVLLVIVSGYFERQDVVDAFQAGAAGFLPKTMNPKAMQSALRLVLAGEKFVPGDVMFGDGAELTETAGGTGSQGEQAGGSSGGHLTAREEDVLAQLCKGLSNKRIADALGITEITVKLHLRKVYQKLGASNRAHAVTIVHERGWTFD